MAPILEGSHPLPCLPNPRRSLIPSILLPWLNLSWYPLHLHRLEPAGVEWVSRCWGDKSPQLTKAETSEFYFSTIQSHATTVCKKSPLATPVLQQSHKTNIWFHPSDRQTQQKCYRRLYEYYSATTGNNKIVPILIWSPQNDFYLKTCRGIS